jgi:nicotinate-nucleotide adenylyltransferase
LQVGLPVKIGFFGGSFDPVHFGHLMAAQDACEHGGLDRLIFVPAARAPLKPGEESASPEDRLAMVGAAIDGDPRFGISDYEVKRGGVSYTVETARHFRGLHPADDLYWIIGADQLPRLARWKEVSELAGLVEFICLERPGHPIGAEPGIPGLRLHRSANHPVGISSTEIRERIREGLPLQFFMPHKTIVYIRDKGLYRAGR